MRLFGTKRWGVFVIQKNGFWGMSSNAASLIKLLRRWTVHVALMARGQTLTCLKQDTSWETWLDVRVILKWILENLGLNGCIGFS